MSIHAENHVAKADACQPNGVQAPLFWVVAQLGLAATNGCARRLIRGGGVLVNGLGVEDDHCPVKAGDVLTVSKRGQLKDFSVTAELMQGPENVL